MRDFPVKSQWRHILRHLHQRCSEYERIQKAYEKLGLFQRLATFFLGGVFSTRHIWPMPPYQSRCFPAQLVSPWNWPGWCRSERGVEGEWRCCSHNSLGFFGWTTETEHRNKKDWLIVALVFFISGFTFLTCFQTMTKYVARSLNHISHKFATRTFSRTLNVCFPKNQSTSLTQVTITP